MGADEATPRPVPPSECALSQTWSQMESPSVAGNVFTQARAFLYALQGRRCTRRRQPEASVREDGIPRQAPADGAAARVRQLPVNYYHETLAETANSLELLSGCRRIRIYLAQPWYYGSITPEVLRLVYSRGLNLDPNMVRPIWLERPWLRRGRAEGDFVSAGDTDCGRSYLTTTTIGSDHQAGSGQESATLRVLGVGYSLYLPIGNESQRAGVAALDFVETPPPNELASLERSALDFLTLVAPQLGAVQRHHHEKILKERAADRALRRERAYLLLGNLVKTGPADLAVALTKDPFLLTDGADLSACPTSGEVPGMYLAEAYGLDKADKHAFEGALDHTAVANFSPAGGHSGQPLQPDRRPAEPLLDSGPAAPPGPHPITADWFRQALPEYTHYLQYPLVRKKSGEEVGLVALFLKPSAVRALTARGANALDGFPNLAPVADEMVNLLVEPVSSNLVMDRILSAYRLSQSYASYDEIKNVKEALSLYLHEALTQLAGLADADFGTIGVVNVLENRAYVVVEKETGETVGAKVGDLQDLRVPTLPVGDRSSLLSAEFSITGLAAGSGMATIEDDLQDLPEQGVRREFRSDVRSVIAVPISNAAGDCVAVVTLSSPRRSHFTQRTQTVLESMTSMLAEPIGTLVKKNKVADASIRLYGGRYPYINSDALRALADLYHASSVRLAPFMDELLIARNRRMAEDPASTSHVTLQDVERTFWQMGVDMSDLEEYMATADREIAEGLYRLLKARKVTFREAVQQPYTEHRLSRSVVRSVIAMAQEELGKPQIARVAALLNVCSPDYRGNPEERKKIEQFRQFYYRTVGLGKKETSRPNQGRGSRR